MNKSKALAISVLMYLAGFTTVAAALEQSLLLIIIAVVLLLTGTIIFTTMSKNDGNEDNDDLKPKLLQYTIEDYKTLSFYNSGRVISNHGEAFDVKVGADGVSLNCYFSKKTANELRNNYVLNSVHIWNFPGENTYWHLGWESFIHFFKDYEHEILMKVSPEYAEEYNAKLQLDKDLEEMNDTNE